MACTTFTFLKIKVILCISAVAESGSLQSGSATSATSSGSDTSATSSGSNTSTFSLPRVVMRGVFIAVALYLVRNKLGNKLTTLVPVGKETEKATFDVTCSDDYEPRFKGNCHQQSQLVVASILLTLVIYQYKDKNRVTLIDLFMPNATQYRICSGMIPEVTAVAVVEYQMLIIGWSLF